ncbi:MAG: hypothetical protein PHY12_14595, partial [Eubacteriales bacterium]|nr:hypothetical protein [Eubacteriales bacterium]
MSDRRAQRARNSARNAAMGIISQGLTMLLAFAGRIVFVHTLGQEYLGISGWFSNILSVLSISELGIGTAIVVSLYKPLASGDEGRIRASMRLLRRAYFFVGLAVLGLGLILLPFLPALVKQQSELVDLRVCYLLFLGQSVCSYWFCGYKTAIFTADQRQSRVHLVSCLISVAQTALQIGALVLLHNYYAYVAAFIVAAIAKNLLLARSADREYPCLRHVNRLAPGEDDEALLPKAEKRGIFRNLFGLSMYRMSGTILNATDNLVLGKWIGFAVIAVYSNYTLITTALTTVFSLLFTSFTASVGNLNVTDDSGRKAFVFRCLNLLDGWLYGFAAVSLLVLADPFIALVFGPDWTFGGRWIVPIIALNFLTSGLLETTIMYKDACGLFWQGRWRPVCSAGLNVALSIWWVGPWGIEGVLAATIVSRLLTT